MRTKTDYINELFAPTIAKANEVIARLDAETARVGELVDRLNGSRDKRVAEREEASPMLQLLEASEMHDNVEILWEVFESRIG